MGIAHIKLDLGEVYPIDEVAIRLQGGYGATVLPDHIEVLVSDDETYYLPDEFRFWRPGDRERFALPPETGARVDGRNQWQWVFQTAEASYHLIVPTRSSQAIEETLGQAGLQVWVNDCFSAQLKAPAKQCQLCLAHQLRNLQYGIDAERCSFCAGPLGLSKHRDSLSPHIFAGQIKAIEAACDQLWGRPVHTHNGQRLCKRYLKHRDDLFTFLHRSDVPADNNVSKRALRKSVVHRKVIVGFRSAWDTQAFATIATVLQTAPKQRRDILTTLTSALDPSPKPAPLTLTDPLEFTR